jgi:regulation of enolase protein 1 (concanavalin A-like superfamily)
MEWLNEPIFWSEQDGTVQFTCLPQTDFWRKTHDGGIRDSGHFFFQEAVGDFVVEVRVSGDYAALYDQAGLMIRLDEANWMKCGIEFFQGVQNVSAVVTRDFSDWSVVPVAQNPPMLWLRVVRHGHTLEVYYSLDSSTFVMLRQAYFPPEPRVQVGVMACAPTGNGFVATFTGFRVQSEETSVHPSSAVQ